jgi:NADH:ubiquinone oxidoreductase subunit 6 (subunit J)
MDTTDIFLYAGYLLTAIGVVLAVLMPLIKSLDDPKSLLGTVLGVLLIAGVFFIAYSIADSEVSAKFAAEPFNMTPTASKAVGGMLITVYALFLIAIAGIVITEITKIVK